MKRSFILGFEPSGKAVFIALAVAWMVNAGMMERFVRRRLGRVRCLRARVMALRLLLGGLPGVTLLAITACRRLEQLGPRWAYCPAEPPIATQPPAPASRFSAAMFQLSSMPGRALHRLEGSFFLPAWFGGSLGVVIVAALWVAGTQGARELAPMGRWTLLVSIHLLGLAAAWGAGLEPEAQAHPYRPLPRWLFLLWLAPAPVPLASWVARTWWYLGRRRGATLSHKSLIGRRGISSVSAWLALQDSLRTQWRVAPWWQCWRRPWGLDAPAEATSSQRRFQVVIQAKVALVFLDASSCAWILAARAARGGAWAASADTALALVSRLAAVTTALGGGLLLLSVARALFSLGTRLNSPRHLSAVFYFALSQVVLLVGLELGRLLAAGEDREAFFLSVEVAGLWCILEGFRLVLEPLFAVRLGKKQVAVKAVRRPLILLASLGLVAAVAATAQGAQTVLVVFPISLALAPLLGPALCLTAFATLAYPFSWRHLRQSALPPHLRWQLARTALALAVPLGGLIAFWWVGCLRPRLLKAGSSVPWRTGMGVTEGEPQW